MHPVTLASAASTAALTIGLATYAALIFASLAMAIYDVRRADVGAPSPPPWWSAC